MAVKFFDPEIISKTSEEVLETKIKKTAKRAMVEIGGDIQESSSVSGIELRLLPPLIKDNNTTRFGPFPGYAKLYCVVIVVSDVNNQLTGGIDLQGFPRIGDNENLPINKTIFYWLKGSDLNKAPTQIHAMCSVIKSKKSLRQAGEIMAAMKDDDGYKSITQQLASIATNATAVGTVISIVTELAGIVGKYLGQVEDKPIGTVINSYTVINGDFDKVGVNELKYPTKKVDFEFDLIVRDKSREKELKSSKTLNAPAPAPAPEPEEPVVVDLMKIE